VANHASVLSAKEQITDILAVVGGLITIPVALQITQVLRNTAHKEVHVLSRVLLVDTCLLLFFPVESSVYP
jgi:hypothetical protein